MVFQYLILVLVESGNKCLESVFSNRDENNNNGYDILILDTHLHDISGFDVARKIRDRLPHKKNNINYNKNVI